MKDIVDNIATLKEDKPYLIITDDIIREYIEDNIEKLIEEIKEEL